jgi:Tol biopolymer transport system component
MGRSGRLVAGISLLGSLLARPVGAAGGDAAGPEVWLTETDSGTSPAEEAPGTLPLVHWRTMFTPHFRIHFYDEERPLADRAAWIAERAHLRLTHYLNWLPSGRVDITLNDHTDGANGFASSVPQNYLFAYGVPPASLDELNDFDDFLNLLITHELTHVVHLDTILGLARAVNLLRGKLYAPNLSQPTWFIEGLAVLMESRQTSGGRLRSSFFEMELRVPMLEGRLLGLDAVSNGPLVFPQGSAIYLYGSSLLKYIEDRYGPDKIREISHRYASRLVPGGLNRVSREAVGSGYDQLWEDWKASMGRHFALEVEEAQRRGLTPTTRLTFDGQGPREGLYPRYFHDGRGVVYQRASTTDHSAFVLLDPATGKTRELMEVYGAGAASPTPDGRALIFQRTNYQPLRRRVSGASHVSWDDLFRVDLATGEVRELTRARRAHEPDVSPDGTRIACSIGETGRRALAVVPIAGGAPQILAGDLPGLVYGPTWSPDGKTIAYSRWKPGGFRDIHLYDLASGRDRALWVDRAMDMDPAYTPDGRFLVFSSDRTGIFNLFAYELASERLYQVTNVVSGAFQPTVSPDGTRVVFTGFTPDGFDVFAAAFDPAHLPLAQPYGNARPEPVLVGAGDPEAGIARDRPIIEDITEYHPWRYLYPRNWVLTLPSDPLGLGASAGLQSGFGDPVFNHSVGVNLLLPSDGDASVRADYTYNGLWPSLQLTATRTALRAYDLVVDGAGRGYRQHRASAGGGVSLPILVKTDASASFSLFYQYEVYGSADRLPVADPTAGITIPPETGPSAGLSLSFNYANAKAWPFSISGQTGRRLQFSLSVSDPALGGRFHTAEATVSWTEYFTPPWAKLHALAVLYSGGAGIGDRRSFFALGGFVEQDVVRSLFLARQQCCFFLRGYPAASIFGDQFHLLSTEYRLPLLWIERGYQTFPFYLRRISGAVFSDVGNAFQGPFRPSDLKVGVGAELRAEIQLAYYLATQVQFGFAKGLSTGGAKQYYFVTSIPIF